MLQHSEVMVLFKSTVNPPTEAGRPTLDKNKTGGQKEKTDSGWASVQEIKYEGKRLMCSFQTSSLHFNSQRARSQSGKLIPEWHQQFAGPEA